MGDALARPANLDGVRGIWPVIWPAGGIKMTPAAVPIARAAINCVVKIFDQLLGCCATVADIVAGKTHNTKSGFERRRRQGKMLPGDLFGQDKN